MKNPNLNSKAKQRRRVVLLGGASLLGMLLLVALLVVLRFKDSAKQTLPNRSTDAPVETSPQKPDGDIRQEKTAHTDSPKENALSVIMGRGDESYQRRSQALLDLRGQLENGDVNQLLQYLREPVHNTNTLHAVRVEAGIRNDVINVLQSLPELPPGLTDVLLEVFYDSNQHPVMRDYALQQLASQFDTLLRREGGIDGVTLDVELDRLETVLWESVELREGSLAGTGLIGLRRISKHRQGLDRARLANTALKIAGDASLNDLARTTAIQIAGEIQANGALRLARSLAENTENAIPVRMAAIATLGHSDDADTLRFLEQLASGVDSRLARTISAALKKIDSRMRRQG